MARKKKPSTKEMEAKLAEVEAYIRGGILDGHFVPGQRLVERTLMEQLDISRWKVREVLRRIEADGLLVIERDHGASVRKISRKEANDILDILDNLSIFAIRQCVKNIDNDTSRKLIEESLAASRHFQSELTLHVQAQDYHYENARFWQSLTDAANNPELSDIKYKLQMRLFCISRQGLNVYADRQKWISHHEEILTAILDRDTETAIQLALEASESVREAIMKLPDIAFSETPSSSSSKG